MISTFPLEIVLNILSHLPIHTIHVFQRLSHDYNDLIVSNENAVYRSAAVLHGFVSPEEVAHYFDPESFHGHWLDELGGWKDLCKPAF